MNCAQARALLGDYLEGDLALPDRAQLDRHLRECRDCKGELSELRSTVALLRSLPTPQPPAGFADRVMARIESVETRVTRLPLPMRRVFDPRVAGPLAAGIASLVLFATLETDAPQNESGFRVERNELAEQIQQWMWDDKPATLNERPVAFAVAPRLASTERNAALRLAPPQRRVRQVGFYGRTDPDPQYLDLDAQIDRAKTDPEVFLKMVSRTDQLDPGTFIMPLAVRAARRGDGETVAGRLRRTSHPLAPVAAERFEQSWQRSRAASAPQTYSR